MPVLLLTVAAFCQQPSKADLEKERAEIKRDIEELNLSLKQTAKSKKASIVQLTMVQKKLRLRMAAINNINKQINLIDGDIYQSNRDIYKLRKELDTLKMQYEKSVVYAYKNRSNYDFLNFLFSSTSFNDALKRVAYLRSYRNYREQQAATIHNTQDALKQKIVGLNENKKKKGDALDEENKQRGVLEEEKKEKNDVIAGLKSREKELNKELVAKKNRDRKLRSAIAEAINRAREEALREARAVAARKEAAAKATASKPAPATTTTPGKEIAVSKPAKPSGPLNLTPESAIISNDFKNNKGRMPWPVDKCNVKIHYGTYSIEGTRLYGNNPSLTLATEEGAPVKAVFEGEISNVFDIDGNWSVLIRHGNYFTVYSNLTSLTVSKGQKVTAGQVLGKAAVNSEDGTGEIEFMVMQEKQNLNPEDWIRKR